MERELLLPALDDLASKATPGPWRVRRSSLDADHPDSPPETYYIVAGQETWHRNKGHFHPDDAEYSEDEFWVTTYASDRDYCTSEGGMSKEDAEFVVALANAYWAARTG
jgi:hypothetical protein